MVSPKKKASRPNAGGDGGELTVDRFLIALQKTLSRVSRDSSAVPEEQARSLIVGNVRFQA